MPGKKGSNSELKKTTVSQLSQLVADKNSRSTISTKRAAKKMVATTRPTKRSLKSAAAPVSAKRSPARKRTADKKTQSKVVVRTTLGPKSQPQEKTEFSIVLPQRMSVRAQEKALAVIGTIANDFNKTAERLAYVGGFCLVVLGGYMSLSYTQLLPNFVLPQSALLHETTDKPLPLNAPTLAPTISLSESIPPVIAETSSYTLQVFNGTLAQAQLYSESTGERADAVVDEIVPGTYRIVLDPGTLSPARYILKIQVNATEGSKHVFDLGSFSIPLPETDVSLQSTSETTEPSDSESAVNTSGESPTTEEQKPDVEEADSINDVTQEDVPPQEKDTNRLYVTTLGTVLSQRTVINIGAPAGVRTVEVYVRPLKSATRRFVGLAERRDGLWRLFLDTTNIPNGEYEIIARAKIDTQSIEGSSARVSIINNTPSSTYESEDIPTDEVAVIEPEIEVNPDNGRSFSDTTINVVGTEIEEASDSEEDEVSPELALSDVVVSYKEVIDELFKRYAVARQAEDTLLLELAEKELESIRREIVNKALTSSEQNNLGDDIDTALNEQFIEVKRRIDTFEELRRTATERTSAVDRDGDGISDFDEQNLYQTDPDRSDTDNDGVTDGIEIMRNFDPLDPTAEAIIEYELPQETIGLTESTLLTIESVMPVIVTEDQTLPPRVQAEIRGRGLPNSFVTLYVFSSPIIATVRTGDDGSFVYTFEKELEDGEHEVYVAVTDNTGAIMARSNPFSFVKEAQAFTSASGTVVPLAPPPASDAAQGYAVAVGLGILALGFVLIVLGATLKERDVVIKTISNNDVKAA